MAIEVVEWRRRDEDRLHVEITVDGAPWRVGNVPATLEGDEAAILAHLTVRADEIWCDMRRKEHHEAVVTPNEGENLREAWERVIAAGVDDAGVAF